MPAASRQSAGRVSRAAKAVQANARPPVVMHAGQAARDRRGRSGTSRVSSSICACISGVRYGPSCAIAARRCGERARTLPGPGALRSQPSSATAQSQRSSQRAQRAFAAHRSASQGRAELGLRGLQHAACTSSTSLSVRVRASSASVRAFGSRQMTRKVRDFWPSAREPPRNNAEQLDRLAQRCRRLARSTFADLACAAPLSHDQREIARDRGQARDGAKLRHGFAQALHALPRSSSTICAAPPRSSASTTSGWSGPSWPTSTSPTRMSLAPRGCRCPGLLAVSAHRRLLAR